MPGESHDPSMLVLLLFVGAGYLALALRQSRTGRGWQRSRTASFLSGIGLLALGLAPHLLPFVDGDLRRHMLTHLLLAMLAPIGLVMAAPLTLLLRTLPSRFGRVVTAVLRSPVLRCVSSPAVALFLDLGGMAALYFTPLYPAMMMHPALHSVVHLHFVAAGCLYTWVIAGPDPAPHRPSVPARLVVLGIAVVLHSALSQLLFAGWHVAAPVPRAQLEGAAELMYYGGDTAELLLAFALVTTWHRPSGQKGTPGSTLIQGVSM